MNKLITAQEAAKMIKDNSTLMVGGFLSCGTPHIILDAISKENIKNLTLISNDTSVPNKDKSKLIENGLVKKVITTHIGTNPITGQKMQAGELEVEFYKLLFIFLIILYHKFPINFRFISSSTFYHCTNKKERFSAL